MTEKNNDQAILYFIIGVVFLLSVSYLFNNLNKEDISGEVVDNDLGLSSPNEGPSSPSFQPYTSIDKNGLVYSALLPQGISPNMKDNIYLSSLADGRRLTASGKTIENNFNGYIIEFKEEPVLVYKKKNSQVTCGNKICESGETAQNCPSDCYSGCCLSNNQCGTFSQGQCLGLPGTKWTGSCDINGKSCNFNEESDSSENYIDYKQNLKQKQNSFINSLQSQYPQYSFSTSASATTQIKIMNQFTDVFNGLSIEAPQDVIENIKKNSEVKRVTPNYKVHTMLMDSVPLINADDVWKLDANGNQCAVSGKECLTGKGVSIGIIDTGVDYTHGDLGGCLGQGCKVVGGYDFVNYDNDPKDDHGHGTHVAATAAGNGVLKGVAPDASIYAYKVLDYSGSGWSDEIIDGIERSVDPNQDGDYSDHLDVISLSLAGLGNPDDPMSTAIDNAVDNGVVAVIAAGNSGPGEGTIGSPGTARKAITVGATDKNDQIASFSSRGPVIWTDASGQEQAIIKPDIVAPGVSICAAQYDSAWSDRKCFDDKHIQISGTSMATPHVSGAAASLIQKNPDWTPEEIKMALRNTAVDLGYEVNTQGYGRIDMALVVMMNNAPPIAELDTSGLLTGIVDLTGTVYSENFQRYKLEYGRGFNPTEWTFLYEGYVSIIDGILYSGFDTTLVEDYVYILRLTVYDINGQNSVDKSVIMIGGGGEYECSSCRECSTFTIIPNANIVLSSDISTSEDFCIDITSNNISINCNKHNIYGLGDSSVVGIRVFRKENIKIQNCNISNWWAGVEMTGGENPILKNNSLLNFVYGFNLLFVKNATISNNEFICCGAGLEYHVSSIFIVGDGEYSDHYIDTSNKINNKSIHYFYNVHDTIIENLISGGIKLYSSSNITLKNITTILGDGIQIFYSSDNFITDSYLSENWVGIRSVDSNNNQIVDNKIINSIIGTTHVGSDGDIIKNNDINSLSLYGVGLEESNNALIEDNTISNADFIGINMYNSNNVTIRGNSINNNWVGISWDVGVDNLLITRNNISNNNQYGINADYSISNLSREISENFITNNFLGGINIYQDELVPLVLNFKHNNIYDNNRLELHRLWQIGVEGVDQVPDIEISMDGRGNFWNRTEPPYFIPGIDSTHENIVDVCPYNQSYPLGRWPKSPVCDKKPQCSDGKDNDNDGVIDYPNDFSCLNAQDNDETNPKAQCQDNLDNDGDGKCDYGGCTVYCVQPGPGCGMMLRDTDCNSLNDNSESEPYPCNFNKSCDTALGENMANCPSDCQASSYCGNGIIETYYYEQCDDKNNVNGDGCSSSCKIESGYSCSGQPSVCKKSSGGISCGIACPPSMCDTTTGLCRY